MSKNPANGDPRTGIFSPRGRGWGNIFTHEHNGDGDGDHTPRPAGSPPRDIIFFFFLSFGFSCLLNSLGPNPFCSILLLSPVRVSNGHTPSTSSSLVSNGHSHTLVFSRSTLHSPSQHLPFIIVTHLRRTRTRDFDQVMHARNYRFPPPSSAVTAAPASRASHRSAHHPSTQIRASPSFFALFDT